MQDGETSQAIAVNVDASSSTYQTSQGFDSYFFIDSDQQDTWTIDWIKVQLEFANGANLVSLTKVNRALESSSPADVMRKIESEKTNSETDKEPSIVHWEQRPAF
jgi:hypothetical protein